MKAKELKPGSWVMVGNRRMQFIQRDERGRFWFQCPEYRGESGLDDKGLVRMTAQQFAAMGARAA